MRAGRDPRAVLDGSSRPRHRRQPGLPRHAPRAAAHRRRERRGVPPGVVGGVAALPPTSPAGCTTRCPTGPAASASTTTSPSASSSLLDQGAERVAYVDVDVHHGDGVERIFWDDPRVLTISLHETGQMLFPGTGFPHDLGGPEALGYGGQRRAPARHRRRRLAARLPRRRAAAAARVRPAGPGHPARLRLPRRGPARPPDADGRRPAGRLPRRCTTSRTSVCDGRWVATGGGGYAMVEVVPAGLDAPARDRRGLAARPG